MVYEAGAVKYFLMPKEFIEYKDINKLVEVEKLDKKLNNPGFVNKAPEDVVDKVRSQYQEYVAKKEKLTVNLNRIQSLQSE